ncbi:MAG TPA: hypothetical protein VJ577_12395 [Burkholderiaceae bacterium]|nr:hypothetical protein [Burkholderiaceae bacterium]
MSANTIEVIHRCDSRLAPSANLTVAKRAWNDFRVRTGVNIERPAGVAAQASMITRNGRGRPALRKNVKA